jgi:hypothetical protein
VRKWGAKGGDGAKAHVDDTARNYVKLKRLQADLARQRGAGKKELAKIESQITNSLHGWN